MMIVHILRVMVIIQSPVKMEDKSKRSSKCHVEKRETSQEVAGGIG